MSPRRDSVAEMKESLNPEESEEGAVRCCLGTCQRSGCDSLLECEVGI